MLCLTMKIGKFFVIISGIKVCVIISGIKVFVIISGIKRY